MTDTATNRAIERTTVALTPRKATVMASSGAMVTVRVGRDGPVSATQYRSVIADTPVDTEGVLLRVNREESVFVPTGVVATGGGGESTGSVDGGTPDSTYEMVMDGGEP